MEVQLLQPSVLSSFDSGHVDMSSYSEQNVDMSLSYYSENDESQLQNLSYNSYEENETSMDSTSSSSPPTVSVEENQQPMHITFLVNDALARV
eukprot:13605566-Ditylum_brightwellii.AAC.1